MFKVFESKDYYSWVTSRHKPKTKIYLGLDLKFNSIHFGIEVNECLKLLGPKMSVFFETYFKKFLKLKLILVLCLGLGVTKLFIQKYL